MDDTGRAFTSLIPGLAVLGTAVLSACEPGGENVEDDHVRIHFKVAATVQAPVLGEISGMESLPGPLFLVHNDDGDPDVFVLNAQGTVRAQFRLKGARNRDWEDVTWVTHGERRLLAIGDIGDNLGRRPSVQIYFVALPDPISAPSGDSPPVLEPHHMLELTYPDGARDCEAMAYDSSSGKILLLTKRDKPPRLYAADVQEGLSEPSLQLEFLGTSATFRPPTREDYRRLGKDATWVSQPTGMDIDADGTLAAVITYRSLYLFRREAGESWAQAFGNPPREFLGPVSPGEEAIAFDPGMGALYITTEGHHAPIYHVALPAPK